MKNSFSSPSCHDTIIILHNKVNDRSLDERHRNVSRVLKKPKNNVFPTQFAILFAVGTVTLFLVLSCFTHYVQSQDSQYVHLNRFMSSSSASPFDCINENSNAEEYFRFLNCACEDIYTLTTAYSADQCVYAESCNGGEGLGPFFSRFFCRSHLQDQQQQVAQDQQQQQVHPTHAAFFRFVILPFFFIYLVLLFRMLASTAEDYFSPSLEMFCHRLHLPPRFAGVTLLALGNGASDVSATVSAITSNITQGYKLSLGALTGSGMFITTVVVALVILSAKGIQCRGAFIRDVTMYLSTLFLVWMCIGGFQFTMDSYRSSRNRGDDYNNDDQSDNSAIAFIQKDMIHVWIAYYLTFVLIVLIADIYHRTIVLPRWEKLRDEMELQRQKQEEYMMKELSTQAIHQLAHQQESTGQVTNGPNGPFETQKQHSLKIVPTTQQQHYKTHNRHRVQDRQNIAPIPLPNRAIEVILRTMSSYDREDKRILFKQIKKYQLQDDAEDHTPNEDRNQHHSYALFSTPENIIQNDDQEWGLDGEYDDGYGRDRPVILRGSHGILSRHHQHLTSSSSSIPFSHSRQNDDSMVISPNRESHSATPSSKNNSMFDYTQETASTSTIPTTNDICVASPFWGQGLTSYNWYGAFVDGKQELLTCFKDIWDDIFYSFDGDRNAETNVFNQFISTLVSWIDKCLLVLELPFTILRKVTVPLPCDGSYCKTLVALSVSLSPLWLGFYIYISFGKNLFWLGGGVPYILIAFILSSIFGLLVLRFAPVADGTMSLLVSVPIALFGFFVAATWIDTLAGNLVDLLTFLGVVLQIPSTIMGVTVLALGNSMGDLSSNVIMAKKGLANMAITACFAGPVFNLLIGLSLGFSGLLRQTGQTSVEVKINSSINVGFIFLMFNCLLVLFSGLVWNKGFIPQRYGYVALTIYCFYIAVCLYQNISL